ncbi:hypothetical protein SAMN05660209_04486 [Geodermatophilus africanus]|uniref:Uncharacterized protein n=1 Tax=Geodermatophilus africanus TaxID=1137993 RepID=A0A1H3PW96_9ACTN|nr:hypothetical protein SAMN05660209_04486 [Geodermatophilus africanus]
MDGDGPEARCLGAVVVVRPGRREGRSSAVPGRLLRQAPEGMTRDSPPLP